MKEMGRDPTTQRGGVIGAPWRIVCMGVVAAWISAELEVVMALGKGSAGLKGNTSGWSGGVEKEV